MKMDEKRYQLFLEVLDSLDLACQLMEEYDSFPHRYGSEVLYQAESHTIQLIGRNPGITVTDLSQIMKKTPSACSQMIRKLINKNWVTQNKNSQNNRENHLFLTEHGWIIFENHEKFDLECYRRNCENLSGFTNEQLKTYLAIQEHINASFREDIARSRQDFSEIPQK